MSKGRTALAVQAFARTLRVPNLRRAQLSFGAAWRTGTVRADTELRLLRFTRAHFVCAVTNYAPSNAAATTLVEARLAEAAASLRRDAPGRG